MPSIAFSKRPWDYPAKVSDIVKKYVDLHVEHSPLIIDLARERSKTSAPIIRPLWYVAPDDVETYSISNQFMLGEEILVAPVLEEHLTEREVYFPKGSWVDPHGKEWVGPGRFKVAAPLEELPYFKRKRV